MKLRTLRDLPAEALQGKRVLVRVDFNVPLEGGKVRDDTRIRATLPTLQYLLDKGAIPVLMSHLGRPKGKVVLELSLRPVAEHLSRLLNRPVTFLPSLEEAPARLADARPGDLFLLENTRFHPGETKNDPEFSRQLAALGEVYVNDAFGTAHRAHASTYGVAQLIPVRAAGLLMEREVRYLTQVRDHPERPFTVVLGGAKVADKIGVLENLLPKADRCLIGGGMAYTFLKARGVNIGKSLLDEASLEAVQRFLADFGDRIFLPEDHLVAEELREGVPVEIVEGDIPEGKMGLDIGPKTVARFLELLEGNRTVFWNGPMGVFEVPGFENGTLEIARKLRDITRKGTQTITGGGDTVRALHAAGVRDDEITHVSTGGGATLEFLAGKALPGIQVLLED